MEELNFIIKKRRWNMKDVARRALGRLSKVFHILGIIAAWTIVVDMIKSTVCSTKRES